MFQRLLAVHYSDINFSEDKISKIHSEDKHDIWQDY